MTARTRSEVKELLSEGCYSYKVIADMTGAKYSDIRKIAEEVNNMSTGKYVTQQVRDQIQRLSSEGMSKKQIANELGVSYATVARVVKAVDNIVTQQPCDIDKGSGAETSAAITYKPFKDRNLETVPDDNNTVEITDDINGTVEVIHDDTVETVDDTAELVDDTPVADAEVQTAKGISDYVDSNIEDILYNEAIRLISIYKHVKDQYDKLYDKIKSIANLCEAAGWPGDTKEIRDAISDD